MERLNFLILGNGGAAVDKGGAGLCLGNGTSFDEFRISAGNGVGHHRNGTVDLFTNNNHGCVFLLEI